MRLATLSLTVLVLSASACKRPSADAATEAPARASAAVVPSGEVPSARPATSADEPMPMVGGYHARDTGEADVVRAAEAAVGLLKASRSDDSIALVRIRKAESQVVAGANYRLHLDLETAKGAKSMRVVIFRSLRGEHSLKSAGTVE